MTIKPEILDKKIITLYKKYAPKNITLQEFEKMVEQDPGLINAIGGGFSTTNLELAQSFKNLGQKNGMTADDFRAKLVQFMKDDAIEQVAQQYAKMYEDIICSDDDILKAAWTFEALTRKQKQDLAMKIINGINKHFGIEDKIKVLVGRRSLAVVFLDLLTDLILKVIVKPGHKNYAKLKRKGYYKDSNDEIGVLKYEDFLDFIGILSHEYGHFIDYKYPNLGMLGEQISFYSKSVYSAIEGKDIYELNPTEKSSFKIAEIVEHHLGRVLTKQIVKKPELYAESLKILIAYEQTKMASLRFKYREEFKFIEKAQSEYDKAKEDFMNKLYPDKDISKLSVEEYIDGLRQMDKDPTVRDKELDWRDKKFMIPSEYYEIESNLEYNKRLLDNYNNDKKRFYDLVAPKEY